MEPIILSDEDGTSPLGSLSPSLPSGYIQSTYIMIDDIIDDTVVYVHHFSYNPIPLNEDEIAYYQICNSRECDKPCYVMKPLASSGKELQTPCCINHGSQQGQFFPKRSTFIQYLAFYKYDRIQPRFIYTPSQQTLL